MALWEAISVKTALIFRGLNAEFALNRYQAFDECDISGVDQIRSLIDPRSKWSSIHV
jgi:hypothetical protein